MFVDCTFIQIFVMVECYVYFVEFLGIMTQFKSGSMKEESQLNLFEYFRNCFGNW